MILTLEEAKLSLRVDFDDDDEVIKNLIDALPVYLENTTGSRWDKEPINPLVKTVSKYLLATWYDGESKEYNLIIKNIITVLTPMARVKEDE